MTYAIAYALLCVGFLGGWITCAIWRHDQP